LGVAGGGVMIFSSEANFSGFTALLLAGAGVGGATAFSAC